MILERAVTDDIAPGEYVCGYLDLQDIRGNQTVISSTDIRFRIEDIPGDHEGPELEHWRVLQSAFGRKSAYSADSYRILRPRRSVYRRLIG